MNNFTGTDFDNKAIGFHRPTQLPRDDAQRSQWQSANRTWWESTPMRYDWREDISEIPGSKSYFVEIDRRFLCSVRKYMPWKNVPFEGLIPFNKLQDKDVLEIGVGQGSHAQLMAPYCKSFTGIDLTAHATEMTSKRLEVFKIVGKVLQMDAEEMSFANRSFDFVWSWGVIHHSADTRRVLNEMHRVLRPGGECVVMVYHRSWWIYYVMYGLFRGIFQGEFRKKGRLHQVSQAATDGAIARYYRVDEWRKATLGLFTIESVRIFGLKTDVIPLPHGRIKSLIETLLPDALTRFVTNHLRLGSFLVARMRKV
jgi:ubiquinone/menaquinone biosynthesis C-methylase UbiE